MKTKEVDQNLRVQVANLAYRVALEILPTSMNYELAQDVIVYYNTKCTDSPILFKKAIRLINLEVLL